MHVVRAIGDEQMSCIVSDPPALSDLRRVVHLLSHQQSLAVNVEEFALLPCQRDVRNIVEGRYSFPKIVRVISRHLRWNVHGAIDAGFQDLHSGQSVAAAGLNQDGLDLAVDLSPLKVQPLCEALLICLPVYLNNVKAIVSSFFIFLSDPLSK